MIVGTPEYMSPEQIRGARVDGRSDVYALGIVLFELLTGDVPFRGDTPVATLMKHLRDPVSFETPPLPPVPVSLRALLAAMLAKEPEARPAGADAVARALRDLQAHAGPGASPSKGPLVGAFDGTLALAPAAEPTPGPLPATVVNSHPPTMPSGTVAGPVRPLKVALWGGGVALVVGAAVVGLGIQRARQSQPTTQASVAAPPASVPADATMLPARPPEDAARAGATTASGVPSPRMPPSQVETTPKARTTASPRPAVKEVLVSPTPAPTPEPSLVPPPVTQPPAPGLLRVVAIPWAQVSVDGVSKGATPFPSLSLSPGTHVLVLKHPAYEPLERRVSIRPGEAEMVRVDFKTEGKAKQP
jgi:serine/threonine-protein kinase